MVVDFSQFDFQEQPVLILKNTAGVPIGTLGYAMNISADIKYNEVSVLEFNIPARVDGIDTPYYDSVVGMKVVELPGIGQFVLINPTEVSDGIKTIKNCNGYSLEYEFTFKKISLAESTYNFWDPVTPDSTLLGIILDMMPSWSVGDIDEELIGKYRTFDVAEENLYNFIKGTIQNSYNCVFDFDTMTRRINVVSASSAVPTNPVYISNENLAKEISVEENTENIITRLDVNGADGVNIRDVNPMGTNQIINLDYFMNTDNFDSSIIEKYNEWKSTYSNYQRQYYNLSVEYSLQVMRRTSEQARLVDMNGEMTVLENEQAVIIRGIALETQTQEDLDNVNERIAAKQDEIEAKEQEIEEISDEASSIYEKLKEINEATNFKSFFTDDEYILIDRYLKDDSVSESSFVVSEAESYTSEDSGNSVENKEIVITGATVSKIETGTEENPIVIYDVKGGHIDSDFVVANVISAAIEQMSDDKFVATAYLSDGETEEVSFPKGCISITGSLSSIDWDDDSISITIDSGFLYFTRNTSEYEKRAVAWELFDYGNDILEKMSQPSYSFSVTSANFLGLEEFTAFRNKIRHGEKIYVQVGENETISPICIGVKFELDSPANLTLEFSDTYVSSDSSFRLADLLDQSISMGKSADLSKYTYSAFMDSGASTKVKDFMSSSLDVSKNSIISSKDQAISWGDSGIRLRRWSNSAHTVYDREQVWLNNNSILMTDDNWSTARIAIGSFKDKNLGNTWGIVAPNIVGTLLAGSNLVIESEKEDGGVAVFKVDAEGCALHNSVISVTSDNETSHILLDPDHGFMIGKYPLIKADGTIDDTKKLFYADTDGNLTLKGTIYASDGEFTGKITATSGYIGDSVDGWTIGSTAIWNGRDAYSSPSTDHKNGTYIGTDGIYIGKTDGSNETFVKMKDGLLSANNATITGVINAKTGYIGNGTSTQWTIGNSDSDPSISCIYSGKTFLGSTNAGIYIGTDGISISSGLSYNYQVVNTKPDDWGSVYTSYYTRSGQSGSYVYTPVPAGSSAPTWRSGTYYSCSSNSPYVMISNNGVLTAHDANIIGHINATSGLIGDCMIKNGVLQIGKANITEKLTANEIDATNLHVRSVNIDGDIHAATADIAGTATSAEVITGKISADHISGGTIDANDVTIKNLHVSEADIDSLSVNKLYGWGGYSVGSSSAALSGVWVTESKGGINYTAKLTGSGVDLSSTGAGTTHYSWADIGNNVFTSITLGGVTKTSWPDTAEAVFG